MPMSIDPAAASRIRDLVKMRGIPAPMVPPADPVAAPTFDDVSDYQFSADTSASPAALEGMDARDMIKPIPNWQVSPITGERVWATNVKERKPTYMAGPRSGGTGVPNRHQVKR